jgi:exopolysaccharide production protein ExoQ
MASEAIATGTLTTRPRFAISFAEGAFVLFLLLAFVSLQPFATRASATLAATETGLGGAGDMMRQLAYLSTLAIIFVAAVQKNGFRGALSMPLSLAILLAWCALSALWAMAPDVVLRRISLEFVIIASVAMGVSLVGAERSLALTRLILGTVLIINWISIPLVHNAVHLPGETEAQLVGDWRGLFYHKNVAGSVSAITAILFFFRALETRRFVHWALFLAAVGFTIMTRSKSSFGLLPFALAAGCVYRVAWRRGIDRAILCLCLLLALVLGAVLAQTDAGAIFHALEDPTQLTGRTAIWQAEFAFIRDHPLLGSGFGTFADSGAVPPLHNYVADVWVQNESHGHNAYLQLLVTIGGIGFLLAIVALVLVPARALWRLDLRNVAMKSVLASVFVFMIFHNFLESDFMESDGPAWVAFLLTLAMLREVNSAKNAVVWGGAQ